MSWQSQIIKRNLEVVNEVLGDEITLVLSGVSYYCVSAIITRYNSEDENGNKRRDWLQSYNFRFTLPQNAAVPRRKDTILYNGQTWMIDKAESGIFNEYKVMAVLDTTLLVGDDKIKGR